MTDRGKVTWQEETAAVAFERLIDASIDTVWEAISTAEGLASWLAPASVDLAPGGSIDVDFGEEGLAGGKIIELAPGTILEFEWAFPGERDSVLRIELTSVDSGTMLRLHHRLLPPDQAVGYGAGWHAHLDQLVNITCGLPAGDWEVRFAELLPLYR